MTKKMKNIRVYLWAIILLIIISLNSCGRGNSETDASVTITYDDIMKGDLDTLSYEEIVLEISDAPTKKFLMIDDSIVVNVKYPKGRNFIDIINIKSNEIIGSYFHVGEGPDEMLFCDVNYDGHKLTATDYIRYRFSHIDSDSLIKGKFKPEFTNYPYMAGITSHPLGLGDSTILANPFRYVNNKYNIRQDAPRFLKVESNQSQLDIYSGYEYHTQNVGQVNMIRNDKTGDIWVLPLGKSVIEVYDSAFNHVKDIVIQSEVSGDAEISVYDSPSGKSVGYVNGYPVAFTDATISPDYNYIYMCLVGKSIGKNESEDNKSMYVLVMNWDGEMINVLYSPFYIYSLSVIDSGLYATVRDNDENRILVKLKYD